MPTGNDDENQPPDSPFQKTGDLLAFYGHLRAYVQHEDGLINTRLTWSFTVHGFLFAVYGILWGRVAELFVRINQTYADPAQAVAARLSEPAIAQVIFLLLLAQIPIAYLGAFVGWSSRNAIMAAHRAIQSLEENARRMPAITHLPGVTRGGADARTTDPARVYYLMLPAGAVGVWIALLLLSLAAAFFAVLHSPA